jgi:uncharacterized protein (TIGR03084 family)
MTTDPLPGVCDDLAVESAELLAVLAPLTRAQWLLDTPADGWTIRDQIAHLAFFDETGRLAATDAEAFAASTAKLMSGADPMAGPVERGRSMEPFDVLAWFTTVRADMTETFRSLTGSTRLPWYGPPMSATSFATARLMETWAHGQDVLDALGLTRVPTARLKHIAHIGVRARAFSYATNGRPVPEGDIAVTLTAPDGSDWSWNQPTDGSEPENSVIGDAHEFCLVVTQRRHIADTSLDVRGPLAEDWTRIAQAFAGGPGTGRQPGQFAAH